MTTLNTQKVVVNHRQPDASGVSSESAGYTSYDVTSVQEGATVTDQIGAVRHSETKPKGADRVIQGTVHRVLTPTPAELRGP